MGRTAFVALAVVVAVAALLRGDPTTSALPGREESPPTEATPAPVEPSPEPTASPAAVLDPRGEEHEGRWWPSRLTGTVLAVGGAGFVALVDLDAREARTHALAELTGGDVGQRLLARGGALLFWGGGDVQVLHPAGLDRVPPPPQLLATSSTFLPSSHPGRVWLQQEGEAGGPQLVEISTDGVVAGWIDAPPQGTPVHALDGWLVFAEGDDLVLRSTVAEDRMELAGARALAGAGRSLAWCELPACDRLHVRDVHRQVGSGDPWIGDGGLGWDDHVIAFDPVGEHLAFATPTAPSTISIVNRRLRGGERLTAPDAVVALIWSQHGEVLFAVTAGGDLVVHWMDDGATQVLDLGLPASPDVAALPGATIAEQWGFWRVGAPTAMHELWTRPGAVALHDLEEGTHAWVLRVDPAEHPGQPTAADGVLYLPSSRTGEADTGPPVVRALDLETGFVRWETDLLPGSDLQWAAPLVTERLILVSDTPSHPGAAPTSHVHALDRATGALVWRFDLHDDEQGFHATPMLTEGSLLVVATRSAIVAIDLDTAQERWRREGRSLPQLVSLEDGTVTARHDGLLVRLRAEDGRELGG